MPYQPSECSLKRLLESLALAMLIAGLLATGASADDARPGPPYYDLAFTIERHGEPVGRPRILAKSGEPAEIRVASDEAGAGYRLTLVARPASAAHDDSTVDVASELFIREKENGWQSVAQPRIVAEPGKTASLRISGQEDGDKPALSVELTAEPVSREALEQRRREMQAAFDG